MLHISDLVMAAENGTVPVPLDETTIEVLRDERRLLSASRAEAYALLSSRQPELQDLACRANDPAWRARRSSYSPPRVNSPPVPGFEEVVPGVWASPSTPRPVRWLTKRLVKRMDKKMRQATVEQAKDPSRAEFQRSMEAMKSLEGPEDGLGTSAQPTCRPEGRIERPAHENPCCMGCWVVLSE